MANRAELGIDITADAADAAAAADSVASSYSDMGKTIDTASRSIDDSADHVRGAADASDELASKSSQATGGLGALASGFELVGAEKYAVGLQSAAMATDFFSGVGDIANLVLESQAVQTIKNTALKAKDIVVTGAQTVATTALTAAQTALNAVMALNPFALVLIGLVALTAAFVVAYKKSETFRNIVNGAFRAVRTVVVGTVNAVVGFVREHWKLLLGILTGPFGLAFLAVTRYRDKIVGAVTSMVNRAVDVATRVGRALLDAITYPFRAAAGAIDISKVVGKAQDMVQRALDAVRNVGGKIVDWFKDLPDRIIRAIGDLGRLLYDTGRDIMQGLLDGIGSMVNELGDKIGSIGSSIKDGLGNALHIGSPSKDMRQLGVWAIEGLVMGLEDQQLAVKNAVAGIAGDITGGIQQADPVQLARAGATADQLAAARGTAVIVIQGAVDPVASAKQVRELLRREDTWTGRLVGVQG